MSKIRQCICCGQTYSYCPNCSHDPAWKLLYDTEQCREVSNIVSAYNMRTISKDKARDAIVKLNILNINRYKADIANVLKELTKVPQEKPKRKRRKK